MNAQTSPCSNKRGILFGDGLVSGPKSHAIRVQLLEFADSEASHEKRVSLTNAIEVSATFFRSLNVNSDTPPYSFSPLVGNIAGVNKRTAHPYKSSNRKCGFGGLKEHLHTKCPARRSAFLKRGGKQSNCAAAFMSVVGSDGDE